nr:hypothetical protein [Tanacetum cinerariifolium]
MKERDKKGPQRHPDTTLQVDQRRQRKDEVGALPARGKLIASVEEKDSLTHVWHKRLGHISDAGLQVLEKQGLFGKKSLDLWGPSQVESLGGKKYFLSIVDDYSKRVWVYLLRFKHEAFQKFKEWKQLVENQTERTSGLPKTFWAEATCTAAYLINRSPSTAIEKKTPMEMWSGHPSDYGMLRTFGCVAYSHVQQGKLEPRAVKCVLLRYLEGVKGYRLYRLDNESPKIVTSRNVVFNESVMYKDTLKDSGAGANKSVEELQLVRDREPRKKTKPLRFRDESNMAAYAFAAAEEEDTHEPLTYQEAVVFEDSSKWKAAMKEEMDSLRKIKTWELVDHQAGQKLVSCKWLFKIKEGIEGVQKPRYKARLVNRGFTQRAGIDYNEQRVKRMASMNIRLNIEKLDGNIIQRHGGSKQVGFKQLGLGVKTGVHEVHVQQGKLEPRAKFESVMYKDTLKDFGACVDKSVEELQVEVELQRLNNHTLEEDQTDNEDQTDQDDGDDEDAGDQEIDQPPDLTDHQLVRDREPRTRTKPLRSYGPGEYIYLFLYVDDMLIACKSKAEIGSTKSLLKREFDMKDLEEAKKILGIEIVKDRSRKILRVSQSG